MFLQRTLRSSIELSGVGLHTGQPAKMRICPAPSNTKVRVVRKDLEGNPYLEVQASNTTTTQRATTLGQDSFSISTVEHCLSALTALRIDNATIEMYGDEVPILDGSALPFLKAIRKVGVVELDQPRLYMFIKKPISITDGDKFVKVLPYSGLRVSCVINFEHPSIGLQELDLDINETTYTEGIASARTFGFVKDVEQLKKMGLVAGASLENAIGLTDEGIANEEGLRFRDEFVRHKILDALGDLVMLGAPLMGHVILHKAGHGLMKDFVQKVLESDAYELVDLGSKSMSFSESPTTSINAFFTKATSKI